MAGRDDDVVVLSDDDDSRDSAPTEATTVPPFIHSQSSQPTRTSTDHRLLPAGQTGQCEGADLSLAPRLHASASSPARLITQSRARESSLSSSYAHATTVLDCSSGSDDDDDLPAVSNLLLRNAAGAKPSSAKAAEQTAASLQRVPTDPVERSTHSAAVKYSNSAGLLGLSESSQFRTASERSRMQEASSSESDQDYDGTDDASSIAVFTDQDRRRRIRLEKAEVAKQKRQEVQEAKRIARDEKAAQKELDKHRRAAERQANRVKSVEQAVEELIVDVDTALDECVGADFANAACANLESLGAHVRRLQLPLPGVIVFQRATRSYQFEESQSGVSQSSVRSSASSSSLFSSDELAREMDVIWILPGEKFARILQCNLVEVAIVDALKRAFPWPGARFTLIVRSLEAELRRAKQAKDAQMRAAVKNVGPSMTITEAMAQAKHSAQALLETQFRSHLPNPTDRRLQQEHELLWPTRAISASELSVVTQELVDDAIFSLSIEHGVQVTLAKSNEDAIDWIVRLTKAVASGPYNTFSSDFSFDVQSAKLPGSTPEKVWVNMLLQIPSVSEAIAETVAAAYPSLSSLLQAYDACGSLTARDALLVGLRLHRHGLPVGRTIGATVAQRIAAVMNSTNPNLIIPTRGATRASDGSSQRGVSKGKAAAPKASSRIESDNDDGEDVL
ncbi:hypothetical protein CAOG_08613 [Capsaspora owczarzaki ATCC 30864]|uniref:ERCC4 domain-containing protein n=1 Tax=Capsaspora owczarzaki (strain ATCC 30864) TaxID=595528 RepID=A0A0D2X1T9_CAPO3|nr:hypothetical protein CAOG_08613 [Capsaspora owczarzaki ATCC 30864]KJE91389.1 hypothetical protein CAOG_008613 [Capsaspora owczarzaki ATCC 30864]|eukprot:XP_011270213.1 hypothetical protein CAOG_08613 [Capsaspora owczarzaki ATCC 30864]